MAKFKIDIGAKLLELPKAAKIAIAVIPAALVIGLVTFFVIYPKTATVEKLKADISAQEAEISKSQSMAGKLDELKAQNAMLKSKLKALQEHLPEEEEISTLLKQVSDLGVSAGMRVLTWRPSQKRKHVSGIVYEVPVSVSLTGSYHKLGTFFASLTELDRIVNVSGIRLGGMSVQGKEMLLSISFTAVTFTAVSKEGIVN